MTAGMFWTVRDKELTKMTDYSADKPYKHQVYGVQ